ncbi:phytoene/squalene synthase family protein [Puerhibacterium sp. TATVAM-FAB25]|uniref:phytoene/squalene synthase family protein n=1 Tax=Puerhibacterium sp. TATVAM-FAB25 TaxID=3093699 RepID=UPI00397A0419
MTLVAPRAGRPAATTYDRVASASAAAVIRGYSTSFGWACRLLAEPVRTHVRNVYALVRVADEIVDEPDGGWADGDRGAALDALEAETYAALRTGRSANLVVHAFAVTARRSGIDRALVEPFFRSMRADLSVTTHDPQSYRDYVHGSAEVVGLMCLRVFVDGDDAAYERLAPAAARLGAAFQKLNFLRDVAEDHGVRGRSYLPGVDCSALTDADRDDVLDDIDDDLAVAAAALPGLPASSRVAVAAAHGLFAELARRLRATPAEVICRERVRVPDRVKATVLARVLVTGGRG